MTYEEFEEYRKSCGIKKNSFNVCNLLGVAEKEAPALIKKYVTKDTPEIWYDLKITELVTSDKFIATYMIMRPREKWSISDFKWCLEVYIGIWATGGKAFKCK